MSQPTPKLLSLGANSSEYFMNRPPSTMAGRYERIQERVFAYFQCEACLAEEESGDECGCYSHRHMQSIFAFS